MMPLMFGPNITGSAGAGKAGWHQDSFVPSGAFASTSEALMVGGGEVVTITGQNFNASRSSSVFGSSSSVQPPAIRFLPCIRT